MHLLPLSLGRLAELADRTPFNVRYATQAVFLRVNPDNTFEATATDTKVLARVTGPCAADASAFPDIPDFTARPGGVATALVPSDFWKRSFAYARKLTSRVTSNNSVLRSVAVRIGEVETSFAAANEYAPWSDFAENVPGRFPPYAEMIDSLQRKPIGDHFAADPRLLAELVRTAGEFVADPEDPRVDVETRGPASPILVRAGRPDGVQFVGILMPRYSGEAAKPAGDADLSQRCADLTAERDSLARQVEELKAALARAAGLPGSA